MRIFVDHWKNTFNYKCKERMLEMAVLNIKATIQGDIHKVWEVVLNIAQYTWRSDLSKTEIVSEKQFIEYTKDGYPTTFLVTLVEPYKRWEFDMENSNIKGHWIKKVIMKPFLKSYLRKQQAQFVSDLQRAISQ